MFLPSGIVLPVEDIPMREMLPGLYVADAWTGADFGYFNTNHLYKGERRKEESDEKDR